jgi:hypothetical protein
MHAPTAIFTALSLSVALAASEAVADVTISSDATANMTCSGGVCTPTATDAVLNVGDLETLLASGDVTVTTTGSGEQADNIDVTANFDWSSDSGLTLDAYQAITFTALLTDGGTGNMALVTNDGGSGGTLSFLAGASLSFANLTGALTVNGLKYKLVDSIEGLNRAILAKPHGAFALIKDIDAGHRVYRSVPVPVVLNGSFVGLGHVISHLDISDSSDEYVGFFYELAAPGVISSVGLEDVHVQSPYATAVGSLVGNVESGTVSNSWASGFVRGVGISGGLVGQNVTGTISDSWSSAKVEGNYAGGLVGESFGDIESSFAMGNTNASLCAGGIAGGAEGTIDNSYATGNENITSDSAFDGGFAGCTNNLADTGSYSTGKPRTRSNPRTGGFVGSASNENFADCYWDTTTSKTTQGVGNGSDSGITGLTTEQLQSGLPAGFDPTIWAEDTTINNGFPYLITNPPRE